MSGTRRETGTAPTNGGGLAPSIDWPAALAEHARWLRLVVLARVSEPSAVEEVMQEVALAALGSGTPAGVANPPAWLHRLAVRQALLYRRRLGRRRRHLDRYAATRSDEAAADADPLGWLLREERHALVRRALGRLPARDAELLLLKYADGASAPEIARRLGATVAAVESRLHRVRARLRDELVRLDAHDPVTSSPMLS